MFRFYSPIFFLQLFCIYHAFTTKKDYWWFFLILFLPLFGSLIYLYYHFVNRQNLEIATNTVNHLLTSEPELKRLQKELQFADTVTNRLQLADYYLQRGEAALAREQYETCLNGTHKGDPAILTKLLQAHYLEENYQEVVRLGERLHGDSMFEKSPERVSFAFALQQMGEIEKARQEFIKMDGRFSNYFQRYSFAKFLHSVGETKVAENKITDLMAEINEMGRTERQFNMEAIRLIKGAARNGL